MLHVLSKAQVAMWDIRSKATSTLRSENGEANVFAIIVGILIVAIVLGGIAFFAIRAGQTVTDRAEVCLNNPSDPSCNSFNI